ncbi:hypothetical protein ABTN33_19890, partial [Acinetobacter baumannii]
GQAPGWDNSFQGSIDDVSVWNIARPADALRTDLYRRLTGRESGLNALWSFEGTGATVSDVTGHGNTGYLGSVITSQPAWTSDSGLS